jgi:hypothetical protein
MPADRERTARLRELHEDFAWKVNAAVAQGREDLIRQFSGEYVEEAVRILADGSPPAGGAHARESSDPCGPRSTPPLRRGRWRGLADATRAFRRRGHG